MDLSLQMAHNDQGDLYYACGDFNTALKCYSKNAHYCAITDHTLEMHLNCIKCGLHLQNMSHVYGTLPKALHATPESDHLYVVPPIPASSDVCPAACVLQGRAFTR